MLVIIGESGEPIAKPFSCEYISGFSHILVSCIRISAEKWFKACHIKLSQLTMGLNQIFCASEKGHTCWAVVLYQMSVFIKCKVILIF